MSYFAADYRLGVEDWLDDSQVNQFLDLIEIDHNDVDVNLATLQALIYGLYRTVPFQNLTMLTRGKTPPSPQQVIDDMLVGIGGLCNTMNPFFAALLHRLGFRVGFIKASMMQPDCHIGLMVEFGSRRFWLDVGNGFPYLHPLFIEHGRKASVLGFEYQLLAKDDGFELEQNVLGQSVKRINQSFNLTLCGYDQFDEIRARHYSEAGYGPFLTGIRLNRWEALQGFLLRDDQITQLPKKTYEADRKQIVVWIEQYFQRADCLVPLIKQSWEILDEQSKNK